MNTPNGLVSRCNLVMATTTKTKGAVMSSKKRVYVCPACKEKITVYVDLIHPPTCSKHTGGGKVMKPQGEE